MKTSPAGLNIIKNFEGLRLKAYLCPAGVPTIGYGHTKGVSLQDPDITKERANELLAEDVAQFEAGVNDLVKVPLNQNQFDALVSFAFNLGVGALKQSTLLKKLNSGDYTGASAHFGRWIFAGNKAMPGLRKRRAAERMLFDKAVEVPPTETITT